MVAARMPSAPPVVLTIAGSDNSAGAGLQADLKTFSAFGVYGLTVVTCVVAEVPGRVTTIHAMPSRLVREQLELSLAHFPVGALKTGLLHSREIIAEICAVLESSAALRGPFRLVVDPVMVASSGDSLLEPAAVALYRERLFPLATLVTPNLDETAVLLGRAITSIDAMRAAGTELTSRYGTAFLLKGGHLRGEVATDLLFIGEAMHEFSSPFIRGVSTHGTGCTYAAAITASLGRGRSLVEAVGEAKRFVTASIEQRFAWLGNGGETTVALNHLPDFSR